MATYKIRGDTTPSETYELFLQSNVGGVCLVATDAKGMTQIIADVYHDKTINVVGNCFGFKRRD